MRERQLRNELDRENAGTAPCEILIPTRSINGLAVSPVPRDLGWRDAREGIDAVAQASNAFSIANFTPTQSRRKKENFSSSPPTP